MSAAVEALVRQAVEAAAGEAIAAARAEGFAAGLAEAQRDLAVRLKQFGLDLVASPLGGGPLLGNASGPGSLAAMNAAMQAAGPIPAEPKTAPTAEACTSAGSVPVHAGAVPTVAAPASECAAERLTARAAWRTAWAEEILAELWPTFTHKAEIEARIAEANGVAFPAGVDLSVYAHQAGLKRPEGFVAWLRTQPKGRPASAAAPVRDPGYVRLADRHAWRTDARKAVLLALYPGGALMPAIRAEMANLPGPPMPDDMRPLWNWVSSLEIRRIGSQRVIGEAAPADDAEGDDAPLATPPPVEIVARKCLNCQGGFQANGRYERLCVRCRKRSEVEAA